MFRLTRRVFMQLQPRRLNAHASTGIEHAEAMKRTGSKKKMDSGVYKCSEYFNFNKYSYVDKEIDMMPARMPQPSNKKPDEERKAKP